MYSNDIEKKMDQLVGINESLMRDVVTLENLNLYIRDNISSPDDRELQLINITIESVFSKHNVDDDLVSMELLGDAIKTIWKLILEIIKKIRHSFGGFLNYLKNRSLVNIGDLRQKSKVNVNASGIDAKYDIVYAMVMEELNHYRDDTVNNHGILDGNLKSFPILKNNTQGGYILVRENGLSQIAKSVIHDPFESITKDLIDDVNPVHMQCTEVMNVIGGKMRDISRCAKSVATGELTIEEADIEFSEIVSDIQFENNKSVNYANLNISYGVIDELIVKMEAKFQYYKSININISDYVTSVIRQLENVDVAVAKRFAKSFIDEVVSLEKLSVSRVERVNSEIKKHDLDMESASKALESVGKKGVGVKSDREFLLDIMMGIIKALLKIYNDIVVFMKNDLGILTLVVNQIGLIAKSLKPLRDLT